MNRIRLLDKQLVDKIAAGEVVINAASAIKELLENSIDAGSGHIKVQTYDGGKTVIRVIDDGCGIYPEDIKYAFTRNATSKITDSIQGIKTLGFRGEALSSISYVSKVRIITKVAQNDTARQARVLHNDIVEMKDVSANNGTNIEIRDLFYNIPARLKHLKRDGLETAQIIDIVGKVALAHAEISFTLECDGKEIFFTSGNGNLLECIHAVLGRNAGSELIEVDYRDEPLYIKGFMSSPSYLPSKYSFRYIILNGRYIKSDAIARAVDSVYYEHCKKHAANFVLQITLPYEMIDVNIHPAKLNVKFTNESLILLLIKQGIERSLMDTFIVREYPPEYVKRDTPEVKAPVFEEAEKYFAYTKKKPLPDISIEREETPCENIPIQKETEDFQSKEESDSFPVSRGEKEDVSKEFSESAAVPEAQSAVSGADETSHDNETPPPTQERKEDSLEKSDRENGEHDALFQNTRYSERVDKNIFLTMSTMKFIGNAFGLYSMFEMGNDIYAIDTHAAHERVLYERYLHEVQSRKINRQTLLMPVTIELSAKDFDTAMEYMEQFEQIGFEIDSFGDNTILVRSFPYELVDGDIESTVRLLIQEMRTFNRSDFITKRNERLLRLACHNAVRGDEDLSEMEVRELLKQLYTCEMPYTCPHGRAIVGRLNMKYFMKAFERIK